MNANALATGATAEAYSVPPDPLAVFRGRVKEWVLGMEGQEGEKGEGERKVGKSEERRGRGAGRKGKMGVDPSKFRKKSTPVHPDSESSNEDVCRHGSTELQKPLVFTASSVFYCAHKQT